MKCKTCLINSTCITPCDLEVNEKNIEEFLESDILIQRLLKYHKIMDLFKTYYLPDKIKVYINFHSIQFWKNGKFHRDGDKPAIIEFDGHKWWYTNGK